ncbi:MAG TPA: PP2C family protein-serine/threonine phosphatase [bacterium]|nr:PP2C family protein-serine/threonine phosphatase [bacterium]HOL46702.1 PP2C family protein-serine/threonine phosphatase [bacterium]HPQ18390.1 PP2C family protein-serine/threonine phosphatase [bacterium]
MAKQYTISFRIKIIFGFVFIALFTIFLAQSVSQNYVRKILISQLLKNLNFIPDIIYSAKQAIQWNNELLIADKVIQLSKNEDVESIIILKENNEVYISNDPNQIKVGSIYEIKFSDYKKAGEYLVDYEEKELSLIKDFYYENKETNKQNKYYIVIKLRINKIINTINELNKKFLLIGIGIIFFGISLAIPFSSFFSKKLIEISQAVRIIGQGNWDYIIPISRKFKDEIDDVAAEINQMAQDLKVAEHLKIEQEVIKQELQIATEIQHTLLPKTNPQFENISTYSFYRSAKEVGGDYFDWLEVSENLLGIVMADVSGKGVPGAFVMTMMRSTLRSHSKNIDEPAEVLKRVNAVLKPDIKKGMFITVWYGILNLNTYLLKFANAGHLGLIVFKNSTKTIEIYRPKGMSVGLVKPEQFNKILQPMEIKLDKGDIILQYTDGVTEAYDKEENLFGDERLKNIILEHNEKSPKEIIEKIVEAIEKHAAECEQSDDIALIALKIEK